MGRYRAEKIAGSGASCVPHSLRTPLASRVVARYPPEGNGPVQKREINIKKKEKIIAFSLMTL